jgi:hypothetical protein
MHTALIFKEQAKVKDIGLREKGLAQPHYSIQHIEGYDLLCYKEYFYLNYKDRLLIFYTDFYQSKLTDSGNS